MKEVRDRLVVAVLAGDLEPTSFPARFSDAADAWLSGLLADAVGRKGDGIALVAVGGYGRSELCPGSDLDVVLVHHRRRHVEDIAQRVWYSVWDSGIKLDHSVRTPKEAVAVAHEDQRALLGLLDGRVVAGDPSVVAPMLSELEEWWRAHARTLLAQLSSSAAERRERYGEVPFLLEPDLKESAGGLRDLEALAVAARALPTLSGVLSPAELRASHRLLLAARVVLHARTGGSSDRLLLQEQDQVGLVLGYTDADDLMHAISEAGREVMWASADSWRRINSALAGPTGRSGGRDVPIARDVVLRDGEVALATGAEPGHDPAILVRVAVIAAAQEAPIAVSTLGRLVDEAVIPAGRWPDDLRNEFVSLLEYGASATPVLEALDQRRLLERLMPEWEHVRHRPQRNAYHRFTVDRHLLEAVAEAAKLVRSVSRPDLLLVGALLHDIGKGMPGDHSEAGAEVARRAAERMGFDLSDVEVLERVVRLHLLIPDAAARRDLEDPATIESVMKAVGDRLTLELLAALTEADSIATGPAAWGAWKEGLVRELVGRVDARLRGADDGAAGPGQITEHQRALMMSGQLAVELGGDTVVVVAPDRPGLFSLVAGTLALHRLDIKRATVSGDGVSTALEVFEVARDPGRPVDPERLLADIEAALDGSLLLEARLRTLEEAYARARPAASRPAAVRVLFDGDASSASTVVEVRAADSHGLLHRLTRSMAESGLDVVSAKVATLGHEVVDTFYLRDSLTGDKIAPDRFSELEQMLSTAAESTG
jgi:[protein-PII] uridylyltransferase